MLEADTKGKELCFYIVVKVILVEGTDNLEWLFEVFFHSGLDQELLQSAVDAVARLIESIPQAADCVKSLIIQLLVMCLWRVMCVTNCQADIIAGRQFASTC